MNLLLEGALAAAELLALLFVPPAAAGPVAPGSAAADRPVQLHRLSTSVDVRLLGALADVRVTQHLRNDGPAIADLAAHLPAIDERADSLRVIRAGHSVELLGSGDCSDAEPAGHARLSGDEAIADALRVAPGAEAIVEVASAQPLAGSGRSYRLVLPIRLDAHAPRAVLVDQGDAWFLVVVPHRRATTSSLVLRPAKGPSETLAPGAVDAAIALLIPLADRRQLDALAAGAIELELGDEGATTWTTVLPDVIDERDSVLARVTE